MTSDTLRHQQNACLLHATGSIAYLVVLVTGLLFPRDIYTFRADEGIPQFAAAVAAWIPLVIVPLAGVFFSFKRPQAGLLVVLSVLFLVLLATIVISGALTPALGSPISAALDNVTIWIARVSIVSYAVLGVAAFSRILRQTSVAKERAT